jgi:hypothetical protein
MKHLHKRESNERIHHYIDKIIRHIIQFQDTKQDKDNDWDGGSYYDNFVDGRGW